MKATILGCSGSRGLPMTGGFWGKCDPANPKNRRHRSSALIEDGGTKILIDAGPDLRHQINNAGITDLQGVLLTHAHADHVNGLEDLSPIAFNRNELIDVYLNDETYAEINRMWPYMFQGSANGIYSASLKAHLIANSHKFKIGNIAVESIEQDHRVCTSLGYRFGDFAYSIDFAFLKDESIEALQGIETWFVGCAGYLRDKPGNHATLKQVLEWVAILRPKMTYLGVLTSNMDYNALCEELPPHIRPAYDGMEIEFQGA